MDVGEIFVGSSWETGPALTRYLGRKKTIGYVLEKYFDHMLLYLFNNLVFYVDDSTTSKNSAFQFRFLKVNIRAHGGTVTGEITPETTHIVTDSSEQALRFRNDFEYEARRIVTFKWIRDCISGNTLLSEDSYRP